MRTLQDQLIEKGLSQPAGQVKVSRSTKTRGKPEEQFTPREWAELMGTKRPTYGRAKGGALRQR
ncbi:hypothetical protein NCCP2222_19340 [Sporosarcina sp. NCCP-2222]|uniref:hypothetical protein n=1 Tax=Sporosarcina sp. NCCP-2222 TaxID=2935073 RepID=UPI0020867065|nr:hypothetical protein [Sporosarcina sp. NCCP-2222]GKV55987.1 hypothetical protein NCCP2222_19340 [Sporosarcina sp. NCCP-2222]